MVTQETLLNMINAANTRRRYRFKLSDFTYGAPVPDATRPGCNTKIILTARLGSGFKGKVPVYYGRWLLGNANLPTTLISEAPFTPNVVLNVLDESTIASLTAEDATVVEIPPMSVGEIRTVTITARDESLGWISSTNIALLFGLPPNVDELYELMNVSLPRDLNG